MVALILLETPRKSCSSVKVAITIAKLVKIFKICSLNVAYFANICKRIKVKDIKYSQDFMYFFRYSLLQTNSITFEIAAAFASFFISHKVKQT